MAEQKNILKIFVATRSAPLKRQLLRMINNMADLEVVGEAEGPQRASWRLPTGQPDLVLLHLDPTTSEALELYHGITHHYPCCSKVVLLKTINANSSREYMDKHTLHPSARKGIATFIDPDDHASILAYIKKSVAEKNQNTPMRHPAMPDASTPYLHDHAGYVADAQQAKKLSGIASGAQERRRHHIGRRHTEIELKQSAARFQSFVEQLPGMPYIANLDALGSNVYVSPKIEELLGFTVEEWCSDPELRIKQLHAEDRSNVLEAIGKAIETRGTFCLDYRIYRRDGTIRWFHDEARVAMNPEGKPLFLQGAILDITEHKLAQAELQRSHQELQQLIHTFDSMRIEEQRRLAHEMHDDFGQLLAAMKMDISTLQQHLPPDDSRNLHHLASINDLVDTMVASVRRIVADLPPQVLDDVGLYSALQGMAANFEKHHAISCRLQLSEPAPDLAPCISTAIYRIVQETLTNIAKHAQATSIEVRLACSDTHIDLCVMDNGRGIVPENLQKPGSFGLIGMRERVAALNGRIQIKSMEGTGTSIEIAIPLHSPAPPVVSH
jgi:two-component system sensor histidine kinase UhpB